MRGLLEYKTNLLDQASLVDLHARTRNWVSEVRFWEVECVFFYKLINRYFLKSVHAGQLQRLETLLKKINKFVDEDIPQLNRALGSHEKELADLLEAPFAQNEQAYRNTHKELAHLVKDAEEQFRLLKKELFATIEEIM